MCRYLQKRDNLEFWGALNPYKIWFWCIIHIDPIVNDDMLISSAMAQLAFTVGELLMEHTGMLSLSTSLSFPSPRQSQTIWICLSRAGSPLLITPIHDVRNHRKRQKCFWRNLTMCIREHKEHPGAIVVKRHVYVSWFLCSPLRLSSLSWLGKASWCDCRKKTDTSIGRLLARPLPFSWLT